MFLFSLVGPKTGVKQSNYWRRNGGGGYLIVSQASSLVQQSSSVGSQPLESALDTMKINDVRRRRVF